MKTRKLYHPMNKRIALEIILMAGYASFFIKTITDGTVNDYVHPRIIPFMIFAAASWIMIAVFRLGALFRHQHAPGGILPLLFFVVPLMMAYSIPPQPFDSSTRTLGEIQLAGESRGTTNPFSQKDTKQAERIADNTNGTDPSGPDSDSSGSNADSLHSGANGADRSERKAADGTETLVMDSDNFTDCLNQVYGDIDRFAGTPIEVVGFVFHDEEQFGDNEFVAARLMMVCCAADMQPAGFLCRYDGANQLEADAWIRVRGTIDKTVFNGETIPYIKVEAIENTVKPENDYIYPY